MYNLKNVFVGISLNDEKINLVVSDHTNNNFNLLYTTSMPNNNLYNKDQVLDSSELKKVILKMLIDTSNAIDLKIEKVILSFDGLIHDFNIHKIKTNPFIYKKYSNTYNKVNEAINSWINKTLNLSEPFNILSWSIDHWLDKDNNYVNKSELKVGEKYWMKINVYTSNNALIQKVSSLIKSLNIEVLNVSLCCLNNEILSTENHELHIEIHEKTSHIIYFKNQIVFSQFNLNFGKLNLIEHIANKINSNLLDLQKIKCLVTSLFNTSEEKESNLIFSTNSKFLNANYLKKKEIDKLINEYSLNFVKNLENYININAIKKIKILSDSQVISNYILNSFISNWAKVDVDIVQNNFMLLDKEYYLTALSIMKYAKNQKLYGLIDSCVQTYYSPEYDQKMQAKFKAMTINTNITKMVQKFVK